MRLARPEEASALAALVERAYAPYVPVIGIRPLPMEGDYPARVAAGQAWVLEEDGGILGLLVLEEAPDHLWLDNIAVEPARHGAGIGRQLMRFVLGEAARRGKPEVRLATNEKMARNIGIYRRLGFTEYGRREKLGRRAVLMRRPVG
ncbi:GNAT family N-acetyltransferase [Roseomonas marmotae]|uniref:GNAT family N-acetyltransferase n=1 Tax=Roseomonas marmotae TaxID=2768161 RepID=A0ABS3K912_9PROT|nr:GNAT family N-acetyltransferase [Roseomonas marmotae]MBO1073113.1 GNAT family N-acetyltransferase [Roseomonas marmotae]QTI79249.1 GNAT family N-acetyltransferase [Roseomonas marmotae]